MYRQSIAVETIMIPFRNALPVAVQTSRAGWIYLYRCLIILAGITNGQFVSTLLPGQPMMAPAPAGTAVVVLIQLAFKALTDIVDFIKFITN